MKKPIKPKSHDGVYPRCVWCGAEIYALAVMEYSRGGAGCHTCGKDLPEDYIILVDMFNEGTDDHPDVTGADSA